MGKTTQQKDTEIKRRALFDAAFKVFSEVGYGAATLDQIAEGAGLTKGILTWHFKNKQQLIRELLKKWLKTARKTAKAYYARRVPVIELLEDIIEHMVDERELSQRSTYIHYSLRVERPEGLDDVLQLTEDHFKFLVDNHARLLERGQTSGEIRSEIDPVRESEAFFTFFWAYYSNTPLLLRDEDADEVKERARKQLLDHLKN